MKNFIGMITLALSLGLASNVFAAATTPMNAVEETAHLVDKYAKSGKIDPSFLNNVTTVTVQATATGLQTVAYAPSADATRANTIVITFDANGRLASVNQNFVSAYPQGAIFSAADAATLLDLGSEAIVDHLADDASLVTVAQTATMVQLTSGGANTVVLKIQLASGKVYNVNMDQNGNVISKGF
jgi:hypothetical protein